MLNRLQKNGRIEVKIHEADVPEERETDAKLVWLTKTLNAKLVTNDYNLGKVAEVQGVSYLNLAELGTLLRPVVTPGDMLTVRLVKEGKEKSQAVAYLADGTMVVVNQGHGLIGQEVNVQATSLLPTGAGVIVFAEIRSRGSESR
jgi:uncharacterized protein YacL